MKAFLPVYYAVYTRKYIINKVESEKLMFYFSLKSFLLVILFSTSNSKRLQFQDTENCCFQPEEKKYTFNSLGVKF